MQELEMIRVFNLLIGVVGLAIGIGVIFVPKTISKIEKGLDKNFSTDDIEKMLNKKHNLSDLLLKKPKLFGSILLVVSFLLLLSSITFF